MGDRPISASGDRIAAIGDRSIGADAGEVIDAAGDLVSPPFVDPHFHMDATLSYGTPRINASGTLLEGIGLWGELREQPRSTRWSSGRSNIATGRSRMGLACDPLPCRHLRRPRDLTRCARASGRARAGETLSRPATRRLSAGRALPRPKAKRQPDPRARHGRRRGRRHPAFRAHDGRWPRLGNASSARSRRNAACRSTCIATRPTIRCRAISRRSPMRRSGWAAGARRRLAPDLDAFDGQLLCLEAPAADRRGRGGGDPQPAHQHHHAGPPRHLPEAARTDPRAGNAGPRGSSSPGVRIACATRGIRSARPTCSTSPSWGCTWRR
jgi:hypothetical protein